VRQWLFTVAVIFSLCLATLVFVAWFSEAYVSWPTPEPRIWALRQMTIGFRFNLEFFSRVPYSICMLLTLALPMIALWRRCRREWRSAHLCPSCGYDLHASADRCPECGATFPRCETVESPPPPSETWRRGRAAEIWRRGHSG
jgi:hypothetical protein